MLNDFTFCLLLKCDSFTHSTIHSIRLVMVVVVKADQLTVNELNRDSIFYCLFARGADKRGVSWIFVFFICHKFLIFFCFVFRLKIAILAWWHSALCASIHSSSRFLRFAFPLLFPLVDKHSQKLRELLVDIYTKISSIP